MAESAYDAIWQIELEQEMQTGRSSSNIRMTRMPQKMI